MHKIDRRQCGLLENNQYHNVQHQTNYREYNRRESDRRQLKQPTLSIARETLLSIRRQKYSTRRVAKQPAPINLHQINQSRDH